MKKLVLVVIMVLLMFGCKKEEEQPDDTKKLPEVKEPINLDSKYYNSTELKEVTAEEINQMVDNKESFATPTEEKKKTIIHEYVTYAPSVVIFKEGKIIAFMDALSDEQIKYYETVDGFKEWVTKYINLEEKK